VIKRHLHEQPDGRVVSRMSEHDYTHVVLAGNEERDLGVVRWSTSQKAAEAGARTFTSGRWKSHKLARVEAINGGQREPAAAQAASTDLANREKFGRARILARAIHRAQARWSEGQIGVQDYDRETKGLWEDARRQALVSVVQDELRQIGGVA